MNGIRLHQVAGWLLALGMGSLVAPAAAAAQEEKPAPVVVEEDLGDGFRAVSVNGGPPAIIDDRTGLIMKLIYGRPAVVDQESGVILFSDGTVKHYGGKGGGGGDPAAAKKKLARMKAFLERAKRYHQEHATRSGTGEAGSKAGKRKWKKPSPAKLRETRLALLLELLGMSGEEAEALKPLLGAILTKQDEIRRSTARLTRPGASKRFGQDGQARAKGSQDKAGKLGVTRWRVDDLPPAVQGYLRTFHALLKGAPVDERRLRKAMADYRGARRKQAGELATLRARLREVLTVDQEAKLTAVGVLD